MAVAYHVTYNGRYFKIGGTAAAPTVDVGPIDIISPWATINAYCILALGQTIWVGGDGASGKGLYRSIDGGLTWVDKTSTLPAPLSGSEGVMSMAYDEASGVLCCTIWEGATGCWVAKYNSGSDTWTNKHSFGGNSAPTNILVRNGVWYLTVSAGASVGIWRSLDDGETWVKDTSITIAYPWNGGIDVLAVDSSADFCTVQQYFASGNWRARERFGAYGAGPFTPGMLTALDDWAFAPINPRINGRLMQTDEADNFWFACSKDALATMFKRSAAGAWTIENVFSLNGVKGMAVATSTAIMVGFGPVSVGIYDGTWYEHTWESIHAQLGTTPALFGVGDSDPPYWHSLNPDAYDTQVPIETNISLTISDDNSGVDGATVELSVGGSLVWQKDAQQSGFDVTKTTVADGYSYTINPDSNLPSYTEIQVDAYAIDFSENVLDSYYVFQTIDTEPPFLAGQSPTPNAIEVPENISIEFDAYSRGAGVDQYSIDAYVGGMLAIEDGYFVSPFDGAGSSVVSATVDSYDGYHITITRDYIYQSEDTVQVDVYALNMDGY
jgi:hypothetical protein